MFGDAGDQAYYLGDRLTALVELTGGLAQAGHVGHDLAAILHHPLYRIPALFGIAGRLTRLPGDVSHLPGDGHQILLHILQVLEQSRRLCLCDLRLHLPVGVLPVSFFQLGEGFAQLLQTALEHAEHTRGQHFAVEPALILVLDHGGRLSHVDLHLIEGAVQRPGRPGR